MNKNDGKDSRVRAAKVRAKLQEVLHRLVDGAGDLLREDVPALGPVYVTLLEAVDIVEVLQVLDELGRPPRRTARGARSGRKRTWIKEPTGTARPKKAMCDEPNCDFVATPRGIAIHKGRVHKTVEARS